MSTPPNRLSSYRTYSYYHILAICDTTLTASVLSRDTSVSAWSRPDQPGARYDAKTVVAPDKQKGKYCILTNGSTDAAYVITSVKVNSTTAGAATAEDRFTSVALENTIEISEPKGISFLDQVVQCCNTLGVDSANAVFVLKTIFTGIGFDEVRGDYTDTISDIIPMMFNVIDMAGTFTEAGGTYTMSGVSCADGTARLPQYSKAGNSISVAGQAGLEDTLAVFETAVMNNYNQYFDCVQKQLEQAYKGADPATSVPVTDMIQRVRYKIELSDDYKKKTKHYTIRGLEQQNSKPGCGSTPQIHIPAHVSIEDGIRRIMNMSPEVQQDSTTGENGIKYDCKIRSGVTSSRSVDGSRVEYLVYYRVEKFARPKDIATRHNAFEQYQTNTAPGTAIDKAIADNVISYDYLYTGKNTDILEFSIQLNAGLTYLQTATTANSYRGQLEKAPSRVTGLSQADVALLARQTKLNPMPIFFGTHIKSPAFKNTPTPETAIQTAYSLSKHASIEVTDVTMKIVGNPNLLNSVNKNSDSHELIVNNAPVSSGIPTSTVAEEDKVADFNLWSFIPAFARVHIKMPRNNDDISAFTGQLDPTDPTSGNRDYTQEFWFSGYYYVLGIEHLFDNGVFTQTLHMLGVVPDDYAAALKGLETAADVDLTQKVDKCYDSLIGCGNSTSTSTQHTTVHPSSSVPPVSNGTVQSGGHAPSDRSTADVILDAAANEADLSNIIVWDSATQDVKQAIIDAADRHGVNRFTLALIAASESRLKADAQNPDPNGSHAKGLFQFVDSTWIKFNPDPSKVDIFNPYHNADSGARLFKENQRRTRVKTAGDVYLMHFNGGWGPLAVRLDNAGLGHTTIQEMFRLAYPTKYESEWRKQYTNSPTNQRIFDKYNTAHSIRAWAALTLAKYLKTGTVVAAGSQPEQAHIAVIPRTTSRDVISLISPCAPPPAPGEPAKQPPADPCTSTHPPESGPPSLPNLASIPAA